MGNVQLGPEVRIHRMNDPGWSYNSITEYLTHCPLERGQQTLVF